MHASTSDVPLWGILREYPFTTVSGVTEDEVVMSKQI